jgi:hypothetical protein
MKKYSCHPCEYCVLSFDHPEKLSRHIKTVHPQDAEGDNYIRKHYICACCLKEHPSAKSKKTHQYYMRKKAKQAKPLKP